MPKIDAPTVAEHRTAKRAELLDAARILLQEDAASFTMSRVAERAGLTRTSVYSYFASIDDLVDALVVDVFPRWSAFIGERMDAAGGPAAKIRAYVDANLELVARGDHSLMRALGGLLDPDRQTSAAELFRSELETRLTAALTDWGAISPELQAGLVQAMVFRAGRDIEEGVDLSTASEAIHEFINTGPAPTDQDPDLAPPIRMRPAETSTSSAITA